MQKFDCKCCGDCCSGDINIKLNLFDLYKLGKHLNYNSTEELFLNKIVKMVIGQNKAIVPELQFKRYPYRFCHFLVNDLDENNNLQGFCSLHPYKKPLVCILSPYSKIIDTDTEEMDFAFTRPTENCSGCLDGDILTPKEMFLPIENELKYEFAYFKILNNIITKKINSYEADLYYFNLDEPFESIINNLRGKYE